MSTAFADIHVDWRTAALCREVDPEIFYPPPGLQPREAKAICGRCPALDDCRAFALDTGEVWGVWGGMSEAERAKVRNPKGAAA